ncbi:MAG: hypothetical protein AAF539_13550, partial [Planctomycetota bacterium]
MTLLIMLGLGVIAVRTLGPQTIGEQARRIFETTLREHYDDWDVQIERGRYVAGVGFIFDSIQLSPRDRDRSLASAKQALGRWWKADHTVEIARLVVHGDLDVHAWLNDESPLQTRRIIVEGVRATMDVDPSGGHCLASLWPLPQMGPICPKIDLIDSRIHIRVPIENHPNQHASLAEIMLPQASVLTDSSIGRKQVRIVGTSSLADDLTIQFDQTESGQNAFNQHLNLEIKNLNLDDSLLNHLSPLLPESTRRRLADRQWQIRSDVRADIRLGDKSDYRVTVDVKAADCLDPNLPWPIDHGRGQIEVTPQQLRVTSASANFGSAMCQLSGQMSWPTESANVRDGDLLCSHDLVEHARQRIQDGLGPITVDFAASDLQVSHELADSLPPALKAQWQKLQPNGLIDIRVEAQSRIEAQSRVRTDDVASMTTGTWNLQRCRWDVHGDVECRGVDVRYHKFPYPVQQLVGRIHIADSYAETDHLTATAGGQRMHCRFRLPVAIASRFRPIASADQLKKLPRRLVIETEGGIVIDETLLEAMSPAAEPKPTGLERFVRSLNPRGAIELASAVIETDDFGRPSRRFDLRVLDGTMRYDAFAYPLVNVDGRIQVQDQLVRIIGFKANNAGAAQVRCDGLFKMPSPSSIAAGNSDADLHLRFRVTDVAMDHTLRSSLPEGTRGVWDALAPSGSVDRVDVHVHRQGSQPVKLAMEASQLDSGTIGPDTLTLRPRALPYRIDVVGGDVAYRDGVIKIDNLRGFHDASRLVADGTCLPVEGGKHRLTLDLQTGCRMSLDDELISALPQTVAHAARQLNLRGPVQLRGSTQLFFDSVSDPTSNVQTTSSSPDLTWNLLLQLEGNRIGDVGPIHSIRGEVAVAGSRSDETLQADGTLAIDSLHVNDIQLTS